MTCPVPHFTEEELTRMMDAAIAAIRADDLTSLRQVLEIGWCSTNIGNLAGGLAQAAARVMNEALTRHAVIHGRGPASILAVPEFADDTNPAVRTAIRILTTTASGDDDTAQALLLAALEHTNTLTDAQEAYAFNATILQVLLDGLGIACQFADQLDTGDPASPLATGRLT